MTSTNPLDWEYHQVDHLFLLIGENPLPNYVAAKLMLKQGGTPYLVHTTDTQPQAKRLEKILSDEGIKTTQLVSLNDYESDAYHIRETIRPKLEAIKDGKIGLNYTGGTKAMAVHAYRTVFSKQHPETVFSYLDPRKLEICIDREDGERIRIKVKPKDIEVKIQTIFELHGWKWGTEPTYESELPEAARAFAQFHQNGELVALWRSWCDNTLRKVTKNKNNNWLEDKELQKIDPLSLEAVQEKSEIKTALTALGVTGESLSLSIIKERGFRKLKNICKWLDGEWLEHYVLQQIKDISKRCLISESGTSFWIGTDEKPKENKFQFDVAFMRGYQLFAISCTTDPDKGLCKLKLFEAYVRAQQLGGSEARIALVCCSDKPDKLKDEMALLGDKNIAVFGRDDLMDLSQKIEEWIKQADKDAR